MEPVVTVNLAGNPYSLDQSAYDALRAYLDRAEAVLASNPDKAEVIRDLEQAIADKCASYLSAHKSVVSAAEMANILGEMGPVVGDEASTAGEQPHASAFAGEAPKKKLYRLRDGAWIAGVCTGIAAYLNVDVTVVRIIAIILGFITNGWLLLAYIIAMFVIPSVHTSEEWAAAHGVPFNAQEVIDQAKRQASKFTEDAKKWNRDHGAWNCSMRERGRAWARQSYPPPPAGPPPGYATRVFAGLFAFIFSVLSAALLIAFLVALFSFINTNAIFGWSPPAEIPFWMVIVIMAIAYAALSAPFSELRRSSYATLGGRGYYHHGGADGVIMLALIVLFGWFAYMYIPEAQAWMDHAREAIDRFVLDLRD